MPILIVTPKSLSFTVIPRRVFPILEFTSKFPCPVCRHLYFQKLNNICHFSNHLTNLSRSFCKCCLSPSLFIFLNTSVSSTNFRMLLVILSSKSLIYINNDKGPNTDPCGTPLKTDFQFETSPSSTTSCLLLGNHCSIQSVMSSSIPWAFN